MVRKEKKYAIIVAAIAIVTLSLMLSSCTKDTSEGEAEMNTISPYQLSSEESDLAGLLTSHESFNSIVQFAVDESYEHVYVGYDYYEKGKLIEDEGAEMEVNLSDEEKPQASSGKICTMITGDRVDINVMAGGSETEDKNMSSSSSSLAESGHSFSDLDSTATSSLSETVSVGNGEKIPVWAYIGSDKDTLSVPEVNSLMEDKEIFNSYDKCCVFYAKFAQKQD